MAEQAEESSALSKEIPYPPSWVDRFIIWIDRLPGPVWLFYVLSVLVFALLINATFWIDGSLPIGSIYPTGAGFAFFVFYWLGLYQYLTRVGSRSLQTFRPLLEAEDHEIRRIEYELNVLPGWLGWLALPLAFAFAAASILGDPAPYEDIVPRTAVPYVGDIVTTGFLVATFYCLIIRSIRQLRMVRKLHARATHINLLKLQPAHAFSALTARTGIGIFLLLVATLPLDPTPFSSTLDLLTTAAALLLAIAAFVLPVMGIRGQIEEEKRRVLDETSDLLHVASGRLHSHIRGDSYQNIRDTKDAIEALIRERELVKRIPTWPWDPGTLRGFASALLLPIFLWLVTRLLEEFF